MGVEHFFIWLKKNYATCVKELPNKSSFEDIKNFYFCKDLWPHRILYDCSFCRYGCPHIRETSFERLFFGK